MNTHFFLTYIALNVPQREEVSNLVSNFLYLFKLMRWISMNYDEVNIK